VLTNFGDTGWGAVGLSLTGEFPAISWNRFLYIEEDFLLVKYYSPATSVCIIRVARDQHNLAWGALTLLTSIDGLRYIPNVVHVSGKYFYH
jgi:ribonuclease P/MRP protein subunit POP5